MADSADMFLAALADDYTRAANNLALGGQFARVCSRADSRNATKTASSSYLGMVVAQSM